MDFTINLIWVIIGGAALLLSVIAIVVKSSRESERFESWLKTHEKEIEELKRSKSALHNENKLLRELINNQSQNFNTEHRRLETVMANLNISLSKIDLKLELLLNGKIKTEPNHETN